MNESLEPSLPSDERPPAGDSTTDEPADPILKTHSRLSLVWIIPILAAFLGGWLAVRAWLEKGPTITIKFQNADGLEAGKTRIKYKDVEIGQVNSIRLSPDHSHVLVTAHMVHDAENLLNEGTRFWVVKARVSLNQVSGLSTLFSGAYIGMDPGTSSNPKLAFEGLDSPPVVTANQPGRLFVLKSDRLGSLDFGTAVHFRQIKVGEVVSYKLDGDGKAIQIRIFIHAPYHQMVGQDTRFWMEGGVQMAMDANGFRVSAEPLATLALGGIAFETPVTLDSGEAVPENHVFHLYENHDQSREKIYLDKHYYVLNFNESVRGLSRGAPVEFRGIKVGEVLDIKLEFLREKLEANIPVLIALEPERISLTSQSRPRSVQEVMDHLVARGLRAQLKTGSLLTGQLFVDLDLMPQLPQARIMRTGRYHELPTAPSTLGSLTARASEIMDRLSALPVEELVGEIRSGLADLQKAVQQARGLIGNAQSDLLPQAKAALEQAQKTMHSMEKVLQSDAPLQKELIQTLQEAEKAARSMKALTDYLEQHPNSLIFGRKKDKGEKATEVGKREK